MKRHFPCNLSSEDLRAYRRWTRGLYLSYFAVFVVALGLTFVYRPAANSGGVDGRSVHAQQAKYCQLQHFEPTPCESVTGNLRRVKNVMAAKKLSKGFSMVRLLFSHFYLLHSLHPLVPSNLSFNSAGLWESTTTPSTLLKLRIARIGRRALKS